MSELMREPDLVVINKGRVELLPPVLSLLHVLMDLGVRAELICSEIGANNRASLEARGLSIVEVGPKGVPPRSHVRKLAYWARFHRRTWGRVRQLPGETLLWVASLDGAVCLGPALRSRRFILQCHELYDREFRFRVPMGWFLRRAAGVVSPDSSRAAILRSWFRLKQTPTTIPNKSTIHPLAREAIEASGLDPVVAQRMARARRVVIYQGHIAPDRDILPVAEALNRLGDGWLFLLMGKDEGSLAAVLSRCPGAVHVPFKSAPDHLLVTGQAHIGVLAYDYSSLNNVFCAPNKIWEYSGFGIPMLAQDLPGLRFWIETNHAGKCVDFGRVDAIVEALRQIDREFEQMSRNSREMFDRVDVRALTGDLLSRLGVPLGHRPASSAR
jgi:glycosyltransferase involved in cell wall biosynthesis